MQIRKSNERGHFKNHWLNSYHSFSFSDYYDPKHMSFSLLRVLNDDIVAPKQGFGMHPHKDMEIITFMLSGSIEHSDSLGNKHVLEAGNIQLMRAGTGIRHSEINNGNIPAHLLQIWIFSDENSLEPGWWEKSFTEKKNTVLVEPINKMTNISKLSSTLTGNGLKMAQNGYVLAIHENTELNIKDFGNSDIYIHMPTGNATIRKQDKVWNLESGDALFERDIGNNLTVEINENIKLVKHNVVLVFIFPQ